MSSIVGNTMGTTYSIKIIDIDSNDLPIVKIKVDSVLREINQQMSTYIENSEINQFNDLNISEWFPISEHFSNVIKQSIELSKETNGAFDFTIGPLMEIWGFSADETTNWRPPSEIQINNVLKSIGYNNIEIENNSIRKFNPNIQVDVNAIAKGYGVDIVLELLYEMGYENILAEIGGEVRCGGLNDKGEKWKIGIDNPIHNNASGTDLNTIVNITNRALATSGDYRNYIEFDGILYSHTINPITGYPTPNIVASASVIAPTCAKADALATALMVLGEPGIELINSIEDIEAMIILRSTEDIFRNIVSAGWKEFED